MSVRPLFEGAEWDFDTLRRILDAEQKIVDEELGLGYYPIQLEIVRAEQMLDAYASVGAPVMYLHWSFGKHRFLAEREYKRGSPLALELVINSNPCILYCMEQNTAAQQVMVIAHAAFGHNAYYKNNYLFRQWTHPDAIINYLVFARNFIADCEEQYGIEAVEEVLDACHALQDYGVDKYKHPPVLSLEEERERQRERVTFLEKHRNYLWGGGGSSKIESENEEKEERFPNEPQENLLYFIEKNAPMLPVWKRELIRIVRKVAQYFYPQKFTKMMNEGFATFVHYYVMTRLSEKGLLTDGAFLEFLDKHAALIFQPDFDETRDIFIQDPKTGERKKQRVPIYSGINPYALGFKIFSEIRRMCEAPTREDKNWFPELAGTDWREAIKEAVTNYKDESAILQFLSPKAIRDFHFFSVFSESGADQDVVTAIHQRDGYEHIREALSRLHDFNLYLPNIEAVHVDQRGDRTWTLKHTPIDDRSLDENDANATLKAARFLWEFPVKLETIDENGSKKILKA